MLDQPIIGENWNRNQPRITQKRDKDKVEQPPNTQHTYRGYKYKERGRVTLPLPKDQLHALAPLPFLHKNWDPI